MNRTLVPIKIARTRSAYDIVIGSGFLAGVGEWAVDALGRSGSRILIVSNKKVFGLYGAKIRRGLRKAGFEVHSHLIGDGERFKSFRTLESALRILSEKGFTRTDVVVALGGGVVGDLSGFAASIHLRGIDFLQIPTTLLAMIDSSVGGKTGINTTFGKNLVGSFYQPKGVLVDVEVLQTLERREMTAGLCEAIKQGAVSGPALWRQTATYLENQDLGPELSKLIAAQVAFKAKIVRSDESESVVNESATSRKILNFGHTFGHALEKATNYNYLKHGEAVGHGIIFAAELSKKLELLDKDEVNSLNDVVHRAGELPTIRNVDQDKVLESLNHDKKRVGKSLRWVLLQGIGKPVIVPDTEMPRSAVSSTLKAIVQK